MPHTERPDVLIVDDESLICFVLTHLLKVHGYGSRTASRGDIALRMIEDRRPDLIIMDIRMPGMSGFDVLARIREFDSHVPVILMTALSGVRDAVVAMKAGAFDYIAKPFNNDDMIATVNRAMNLAAEMQAQRSAEEKTEDALHPAFASMGSSLAVRRLARESGRLAKRATPVMIVGEIGVGKRLLARTMHALSERNGGFFDIDCTGVDELLLRHELFGSASGNGQSGKLELASDGTLLLDEVSDIPWTLQDTLAEELHQGQFHRPAGDDILPIAARLLFSASIGPGKGIDGNYLTRRFRELYGEAILEVPPLRDRHEDIPLLAADFLKDANAELGREITGISEAALELLVAYHWPGNVHQLKSTIRRAALTAKEQVDIDDIELPLAQSVMDEDGESFPRITVTTAPLKVQVKRHIAKLERQLVFDTLRKTGWNKAQASRMLGVTYKTLLKKVSEYGIDHG
ncbi:MAG: sigma-54-dependent Fis family transcriptional regulator [Bacteroidetes bacterium]|nr:sigma-54-dependent Fis family transcriptional regulator [Bacteroidota bacterium]